MTLARLSEGLAQPRDGEPTTGFASVLTPVVVLFECLARFALPGAICRVASIRSPACALTLDIRVFPHGVSIAIADRTEQQRL